MAEVELHTNPLVAAIVDEHGYPPPIRMITGYLGPEVGDRRRVFLDDELTSAIEVRVANIRYVQRAQVRGFAADVDVVWAVDDGIASWTSRSPSDDDPPDGGHRPPPQTIIRPGG